MARLYWWYFTLNVTFALSPNARKVAASLASSSLINASALTELAPTESSFEAGEIAGSSRPSTPVVWFAWNSTKLRQDAETDSVIQIAMVIKAARQHLKATKLRGKIILHGYSSRESQEEHNKSLALQHAQRISDILVEGGVPISAIQVISHGPNSDWPTLAWNRRVEVQFQP